MVVFERVNLIELMPLVSVNDKPVGSGASSPVTARLAAARRELVRRETGG